MTRTEKIVCSVTLVILGVLWYRYDANTWGLVMVGAGALLAATLLIPVKRQNPLFDKAGIPAGFESSHQKWLKKQDVLNPIEINDIPDYRHDPEYRHLHFNIWHRD